MSWREMIEATALLGASLVLFVLTVVTSWASWTLIHKGVTAQGTVVDLEQTDNSYAPVFEFRDTAGNRHQVRSRTFSSWPISFEVGDSVQLVYLTHEPEGASILSFGELWTGPLLTLAAFGVASTILMQRMR